MSRDLWLAAIAPALLAGSCSVKRSTEFASPTQPPARSQGRIEGVFVESEIEGQSCPRPVEGFDERMLTGTWRAGLGESTDTIVFREAGFYRQSTHVEALGFDRETDWQRWTVSYGRSGIPHIHMEGMRLCVTYNLPTCQSTGGGSASWWDFCENQMVKMPDGGILLAIGVPEGFAAPPRGFSLVPLTRDPDSSVNQPGT